MQCSFSLKCQETGRNCYTRRDGEHKLTSEYGRVRTDRAQRDTANKKNDE